MMENGNSGSKFHALLGKALTDYDFRAQLMDEGQQVQALESMGIAPTPEALAALNDSIEALKRLANLEDTVAVA